MPRKRNPLIRTFQKRIQHILEQYSFRNAHLTYGSKITLFSIALCAISLFFPWGRSLQQNINGGQRNVENFTSFSGSVGYTGFFILLILLILTFSILSTKQKEKFRFYTLIQISDVLCALCGALIIFILSVQSYFFIQGLQTFSSDILYGKGIIFCITSSIVIFVGALIMRQEYRKNIKGSYIREGQENIHYTEKGEKRDNMKFPF